MIAEAGIELEFCWVPKDACVLPHAIADRLVREQQANAKVSFRSHALAVAVADMKYRLGPKQHVPPKSGSSCLLMLSTSFTAARSRGGLGTKARRSVNKDNVMKSGDKGCDLITKSGIVNLGIEHCNYCSSTRAS